MDQTLLPNILGFTWREPTPADVLAIQRLEAACAPTDGQTNQVPAEEWRKTFEHTGGVNPAIADRAIILAGGGEIAAFGLVEYEAGANNLRAFLNGRVRPDFRGRGIGSALLDWMEERACRHLCSIDAHRPKVLRIMFWDRAEDAIALFKQHDFELIYIEQQLSVDLPGSHAEPNLPAGFQIESWSVENAPDFYRAYQDAFSTRTAHLLNEADWTRYWANPDDPEVHPELSFLVYTGEREPAGFLVTHISEDGQPFIAQFGIGQAYRRRGLATALLGRGLRQFKTAGYQKASLMVNIDNPGARQLFELAGFRLVKSLTMFGKSIELAPGSGGSRQQHRTDDE